VVRTGSWDAVGDDNRSENANNITFNVANAGDGKGFIVNTRTGRLAIEAAPRLGHAQDNNVEFAGLGHNSRDALYRVPFGAINPGVELTLRMRSFHNDLTRVRVRFWDTATSHEFFQDMSVAASDVACYDAALDALAETCDFWQLKYTPPVTTTLYYRFIAIDGTSTAYYEDDNFKDGGWGQAIGTSVDNSYVVTVYDPAFQPEQWMKNAVIYQIFPDRFFNGDRSNDPTGFEFRYNYPNNGTDPAMDQIIRKEWNALPEGYCRGYTGVTCNEAPRGRDYYGGDLKGIHDKLDYLEALGVTVIYLNPIFEAGSNHLYDTQDYRLIEKFFGDNDEFVSLANDAHARGMKIILDGVFNHVSSDSKYMDRYHHYTELGACEDISSPYRDWFTFHDVTPGTGYCVSSTGVANAATYDSWWGFDSIPVLNKNNPAVVDLIYNTNEAIARYWLDLGADGWRLDVMPDASFPPGFWQHFRQAVLDAKPDAVVLGELWKKADVLPYIYGDTADSTMNYRFRNAIQGFFGTVDNKGFYDDGQTDQPPSLFASKMLSQREDYPDGAYFTLMNLLTSHDTRRILWTLTPGANSTLPTWLWVRIA
jgi:glycosidase